MSDIQIIEPMTRDEALDCLREIKQHQAAARQKALELYQREGWRVLGYESFKACAEAEFGTSWQHLYRLKDMAQTEEQIRGSSVGELPANIPGRHLRAVQHLPTAALKAEAMQVAGDIARMEGSEVTETHVKTGAAVVAARKEVYEGKYVVLGHMVAKGELALLAANEMTRHLDSPKMKPVSRGEIIRLIAAHGLMCPELIPELGEMFNRVGTDKASKVLPVIIDTGCIAGTPLAKANMTDLGRARYEARLDHIADAVQTQRIEQPQIVPVVVTVYRGDPVRTLKELRRAGLTFADLVKLQDLIATSL